VPNPTETAPAGVPPELVARLPLAVAALAGQRLQTEIAWSGPLVVTGDVADAVASTFGVTLRSAPDAPDPRAHPAFSALYASARTEQVILQLSSRTNLALAGTSAVVAGDGPLAARLTASLTRIGVRVLRASDDPLVALDAHLAGLAAIPLAAIPLGGAGDTGAHYVLLTGENTPAITAGTLSAVVLDASADGSALAIGAATHSSRPGVRVDGDARIVPIDPPLPTDIRTGSGLQWRLLDALVALSILTARCEPDRLALLALERES
jgi:hypothetical protein